MPADLRTAIELHHFGGAARLTWTELQHMDERILDLYAVVRVAAEEVRGQRGR